MFRLMRKVLVLTACPIVSKILDKRDLSILVGLVAIGLDSIRKMFAHIRDFDGLPQIAQ
jgi:hypothetical protein